MCKAGQITPCFDFPGAGQMGNLNYDAFSGPNVFNQDLSVIKKTSIPAISENFSFDIHLEAFNALNHPSFVPPTTGTAILTSNKFGQLTGVVDTVRGGGVNSRIVQWGVRVNF